MCNHKSQLSLSGYTGEAVQPPANVTRNLIALFPISPRWAILSLGWHRDIRRNSPDTKGHIALPSAGAKRGGGNGATSTAQQDLARNNFVCFVAWGLPAFQTAAVIVMRLVDADELLGKCGGSHLHLHHQLVLINLFPLNFRRLLCGQSIG